MHRIGNRKSKAIQPVSNAYEDTAQTNGGRNTHGNKSGKARPPATHDTPVPAKVSLSNNQQPTELHNQSQFPPKLNPTTAYHPIRLSNAWVVSCLVAPPL
jgi:hypothetical protein